MAPTGDAEPVDAAGSQDVLKRLDPSLVSGAEGSALDLIRRCGLDFRCSTLLLGLPAKEQAEMVTDFEAGEDVRNMNAKFMAFMKSTMRRKAESEIQKFVEQWSLGDQSVRRLRELTSDVRTTVLKSFQAPADTRSRDALLWSFTKSVERQTASAAKLDNRTATVDGRAEPLLPRGAAAANGVPAVVSSGVNACGWSDWAPVGAKPLGARPDPAKSVKGVGAPKAAAAAGRAALTPIGAIPQPPGSNRRPAADETSSPPAGGRAALSKPPGLTEDGQEGADIIAEFTKRKGLDRGCEELLRTLPESIQTQVLVGFSPDGRAEKDPRKKFRSYVRSLLQPQPEQADRISQFVSQQRLDSSCEAMLRNLWPEEVVPVFREFLHGPPRVRGRPRDALQAAIDNVRAASSAQGYWDWATAWYAAPDPWSGGGGGSGNAYEYDRDYWGEGSWSNGWGGTSSGTSQYAPMFNAGYVGRQHAAGAGAGEQRARAAA